MPLLAIALARLRRCMWRGCSTCAEAIRVVWHRGRIMQQATGLGRMASVGLTEAEARELIEPHGDRLSIGAVNGPRSVVLSGEAAALETALAMLTARDISHRMLPVQYAFHSAQMARFGDQLVAQLGDVRTASPTVAVYSTVTGGLAEFALRLDLFRSKFARPRAVCKCHSMRCWKMVATS